MEAWDSARSTRAAASGSAFERARMVRGEQLGERSLRFLLRAERALRLARSTAVLPGRVGDPRRRPGGRLTAVRRAAGHAVPRSVRSTPRRPTHRAVVQIEVIFQSFAVPRQIRTCDARFRKGAGGVRDGPLTFAQMRSEQAFRDDSRTPRFARFRPVSVSGVTTALPRTTPRSDTVLARPPSRTDLSSDS